jgi:cupin fold WbuC family metalloprotein
MAGGEFAVLDSEIYHCRTPKDYMLTALEESYIKILGEYRPAMQVGWSSQQVQMCGARMVWTGTEAYYSAGEAFAVGEREMSILRGDVKTSPRQRVRLCTHANMNAKLHEMFVCYMRNTKISRHKHLAKDESFHLLEGELDFIMFNETGDVKEIISMGTKDSGKPFYVRVPRDTYHTVAMTSDYCILHEGTAGPFDRAHTVWANG